MILFKKIVRILYFCCVSWLLTMLIIYPAFSVLKVVFFNETGFTFDVVTHTLQSAKIIKSIYNTFFITVFSVLLAALLGIFQSLVVSYWDLKHSKIASLIYVTPLFYGGISFVTGFQYLYGSTGVITRFLASIIPDFNVNWFQGPMAILVVHMFSMSILYQIFVSNSINQLDNNVFEAAENLGANSFITFIKVTLPLTKPAIFAATLITCLASLNSLIAPSILGADFNVISKMIATLRGLQRIDMASFLSIILGLICFAILMVMKFFEKRSNYIIFAKVPTPFTKKPIKSKLARWCVYFSSGALALLYLLPLVVIVLLSFSDAEAILKGQFNYNFSLDNYRHFFAKPNIWKPFVNSFIYVGISVAFAVGIGLTVALIISSKKKIVSNLVEFITFMPWIIPGLTFAMGLIVAYGQQNILVFNKNLVGTVYLLPMAYIIVMLPSIIRMINTALYRLDRSMVEAARSLGMDSFNTTIKVIIPNIANAVITAASLAFVTNLSEYNVTLMLYTPKNRTVGVAMRETLGAFEFGENLVYIVILLVISIIIFSLSRRKNKNALLY